MVGRGVLSAIMDTEDCSEMECSDSVVGEDCRVTNVDKASARGANSGNSEVGDATFEV